MAHKTTLWFTPGRKRCYLVPDDAELPAGDLELHTSIGRRRQVDAAAVAAYEVSRVEAAAWSKEQLKNLLLGKKKRQPGDEPGDEGGDEGADEGAEPTPLPFFSALSGESAADLRTDPEALRRGLREVGAKLGAVLADATSVSAEQRERAQERLAELRAVVAEAEAAARGTGEADARARREGAEQVLRSFADLVGALGRAAEGVGAKFAAAADELKAQREAAAGGEDGGGDEGSDDEDGGEGGGGGERGP